MVAGENNLNRTALVLFVKAPRPGEAKTRLAASLGAARAAALYRCFLGDLVARAGTWPAVDLFLAYTPAEAAEELSTLLAPWKDRFRFFPQQGPDLGQRLRHACAELFGRGYQRVVFLGSDSPDLPDEMIREGFLRLETSDVVLGPTTDGGYYLIGTKALHPALFEGIAWSTPQVFAQTIARAEEVGLSVDILPQWYDVDTAADLHSLRARLRTQPVGAGPCPRTAEWLRHWTE